MVSVKWINGKRQGCIVNKRRVDKNIGNAYEILQDKNIGIAVDGKISKGYRGQISTFGAAISSGSLLAAVAFFSDKGNAQVNRDRLMKAIMELVKRNHESVKEKELFFYIKNHSGSEAQNMRLKEEILDYAIAIKLAMNLYILTEDER